MVRGDEDDRPTAREQGYAAEAALLSSLLLDRDAIGRIDGKVRPDDFQDPRWAAIFAAAAALWERREPPDLLLLQSELERVGKLEFVGGAPTLADLFGAAYTGLHAEHHAEIVAGLALKRRLAAAARAIMAAATDPAMDAGEALEIAQRAIHQLALEHRAAGLAALGAALDDTIARLDALRAARETGDLGKLAGVPSGFAQLDRLTGGFQSSDLIILAARPGVGKTAMMLGMAAHAAVEHDRVVAIFSLEMSTPQFAQRLLSMESGVDSRVFRTGAIGDEDHLALRATAARLGQARIWVDDTAAQTLADIRAKSRRLQVEEGLDLVVIDYLQLMGGSGHHRGNRVQEVSEISRGLKNLAKELDVPILALAQLSRAVEGRASKIPLLSDLRESGSIEQDADMVLFIYRDEMHNPESEDRGVAELHLAKHRNGPLGAVRLGFADATTRFFDTSVEFDDDAVDAGAPPTDTPPPPSGAPGTLDPDDLF